MSLFILFILYIVYIIVNVCLLSQCMHLVYQDKFLICVNSFLAMNLSLFLIRIDRPY